MPPPSSQVVLGIKVEDIHFSVEAPTATSCSKGASGTAGPTKANSPMSFFRQSRYMLNGNGRHHKLNQCNVTLRQGLSIVFLDCDQRGDWFLIDTIFPVFISQPPFLFTIMAGAAQGLFLHG